MKRKREVISDSKEWLEHYRPRSITNDQPASIAVQQLQVASEMAKGLDVTAREVIEEAAKLTDDDIFSRTNRAFMKDYD